MSRPSFGCSLDRAVTASMNDLINHATAIMVDQG